MRKFSVSAKPEADSKTVGEEDNGSLGLEPFTSTAPFWEFWAEAPKSWIVLVIWQSIIVPAFLHIDAVNMQESQLAYYYTAGGGTSLSSSTLISAPGLDRLDYTLSVTVLYIFNATVFAEGGR